MVIWQSARKEDAECRGASQTEEDNRTVQKSAHDPTQNRIDVASLLFLAHSEAAREILNRRDKWNFCLSFGRKQIR
jgi:hypothetical protein